MGSPSLLALLQRKDYIVFSLIIRPCFNLYKDELLGALPLVVYIKTLSLVCEFIHPEYFALTGTTW